jgi:hypothetical protein
MERQASPLVAVMLLRHARRALLLLGGVLVWWLVFLAGGAAHADDAGTTDPVTVQSADGVVAAVDQTSRTLTNALRSVPSHATHRAAAAFEPAPKPVSATVQTVVSDVEPGLSWTTAKAADVLDAATTQTETVVAPVLAPAGHRQTSVRTTTGTQAHSQMRASAAHPAQDATGAVVADRTVSPAPAGAGSRLGALDNGSSLPPGPGAPGAPGAPGLPGGSSTGGGAGMASLAGLFVMLPAVRRSRRGRDRTGVPSSPAFPPGSSPD